MSASWYTNILQSFEK